MRRPRAHHVSHGFDIQVSTPIRLPPPTIPDSVARSFDLDMFWKSFMLRFQQGHWKKKCGIRVNSCDPCFLVKFILIES